MIPVVSFIGRSGSGKTTFLEQLIIILAKKGVRVCVIKHTSHQIAGDPPGKDTWRFAKAGAIRTILHGKDGLSLTEKPELELTPDEIAKRYCSDADLVITEGYKSADTLKIEVSREEVSTRLIYHQPDELMAVISDHSPEVSCPVFALDDFEQVAQLLVSRFFLKKSPR